MMKILHDIHTHNVLSSCCGQSGATTENYIKREMELGMKVFGLSNHVWDESVPGPAPFYGPQTIRHAEESKSIIKYMPHDGLRCMFGAETEYYSCFERLGMTVEGAKHFDYILVPANHQHMRNYVTPDYPEIIEIRNQIKARVKEAFPELNEDEHARLTDCLRERHLMRFVPELKTDIHRFFVQNNINNLIQLTEDETFRQICRTVPTVIAHPLGCACGSQNECVAMYGDDTVRDLFSRIKNAGAYVEIQPMGIRWFEHDLSKNNLARAFKIAKEVGCQFTFGTDAHSLEALSIIKDYSDEFVEYLGLTKSDIAEFVRDSVIE